jgi:hypothetical protein
VPLGERGATGLEDEVEGRRLRGEDGPLIQGDEAAIEELVATAGRAGSAPATPRTARPPRVIHCSAVAAWSPLRSRSVTIFMAVEALERRGLPRRDMRASRGLLFRFG